ncbi:hypothetical protein [Allochromatium tepidum]|uniref:Uncharacterized protein n=1 Tax=Allochromatium tepidum TaxID=553982 RepID=A0ABN6GC90_9GAMM|nr:hypothetical protein [Allochromatium tepidum]BCU06963.1 hypothetical protein Atep_16400 [Allochromatium tepidum]
MNPDLLPISLDHLMYGISLSAVAMMAAAGVLEAGRKRFDLFGMVVVALAAALGGRSPIAAGSRLPAPGVQPCRSDQRNETIRHAGDILSMKPAGVFGLLGIGLLQARLGLQQAMLFCALLFGPALLVARGIDETRGRRIAEEHEAGLRTW